MLRLEKESCVVRAVVHDAFFSFNNVVNASSLCTIERKGSWMKKSIFSFLLPCSYTLIFSFFDNLANLVEVYDIHQPVKKNNTLIKLRSLVFLCQVKEDISSMSFRRFYYYDKVAQTVERTRASTAQNKRIDLIISNKVYFILDKLANLSA